MVYVFSVFEQTLSGCLGQYIDGRWTDGRCKIPYLSVQDHRRTERESPCARNRRKNFRTRLPHKLSIDNLVD